MTKETYERLEEHAGLVLDVMEDEDTPLTDDQRRQLSEELKSTVMLMNEHDKTITNEVVEINKQKLSIGRVGLEIFKTIAPVALSGAVILTCHKWGYVFEESGMRKLSDVWRSMPKAKI